MGRQSLKLREVSSFTREVFDDNWEAGKAALIIKAILEVNSPRISDIACAMEGDMRTNSKMIHRFLQVTDAKKSLNRLEKKQPE